MPNKKIAKILQKSASAMMAFTILTTSTPAIFSTEYVAQVSAQTVATPANQQIAGLSVSATPTDYQAFVNPLTGSVPPELNIVLGVTLSESYNDNGIIKLPVPNTPSGANWTEVYGAFFNLVPTTSGIIKEIDTTTEPGMILIKLKSKADGATPGLHSLPIKFTFNDQYRSKVPVETVLYNIAPTAYVDGNMARAGNVVEVKAKNTLLNKNIFMDKRLPAKNVAYNGWVVSNVVTSYMHYYQTLAFDSAKQSRFYVQVPSGSQFTAVNFRTYWTFDKKVNVDGVEYDQYFHDISLTSDGGIQQKDFNRYKEYNSEVIYSMFQEFRVTPPDSLQQEGASFKVRFGKEYYFINHAPDIQFVESEYQYAPTSAWDLYNMGFIINGTGNSNLQFSRSDSTKNSISEVAALTWWYTHQETLKNLGSESIKGVKFEYYQADKAKENSIITDSPRPKYSTIILEAMRSSELPSWTQYKYYFEITDTKKTTSLADDIVRDTSNEVGYFVPTAAGESALLSMTLPVLKDSEYISKVIVIPMGTDGQSEGELSSKNTFRIRYRTTGNNNIWPDGTVNTGRAISIPMQWKFTYLDNPNKPGSYPADTSSLQTKELISRVYSTHYSNYPHAWLKVNSQQSSAVSVGWVLPYKIIGTNSMLYTETDWVNPRIMIRVPKFVTIKDLDAPKVLTDTSGSKTNGQTAVVNVTLASSDATHNYYNFQVENYSAIPYGNSNHNHFEIPFEFQIESGAKAGAYNIDYIVSQKDAENFNQSIIQSRVANYLPNGMTREKIGMKEGDFWNYWGAMGGVDAIQILKTSSAAVATTIKNSATNGIFSPASIVPAKSNEDVTMRLTVRNTGSTELDRLKIYNILPYNNDALGSNGNVILKDVTSSKTGFTVKTTKTPVNNLLKYGEHNTANTAEPDLQTATIVGNWENGVPADKNGLSGLFVDFGTTRIAPGEEVNVDLTFTIPDGVSQSAFNQFRYSVQEVGNANVKMNLNSTKAGFDTTYVDKIAPVVTLVGNAEMSVRQNATFTDPGATWTDNIDGTGRIAKGTIVEKNGQAVTNGGTTIDTAEIATYKLEYTYTDAGGNPGNKVYRTLRVTDATAPTIVFKNGVVEDNGTYRLDVEMKSNFNPEDYVTMTDNVAVTKKGSYLGNSEPATLPTTFATVDTNTPGQKIVSYVAADASGNKTTKKLVLNVRDSQAPNIALVGNATISIPVGSTFTDAGANWTDAVDGGGNVKAFEGSVDANTVGSYTLKYKHTDAAGNVSQIITRTVKVTAANKTALNKIIDAVSPISTSPEKIAKIVGINGTDTATAKSALETAFEQSKTVKANPNATQAQVDEATRALTAALANVALDTEKPVITIVPTAQNTYTVGAAVDKMAGVTATDKVRPSDNAVDITGSITIDSENPDFDPNKVGTYTITYIVTDSVGNTTKISRTITISEADNSALNTKVQEAERAMNNPKVVDDANKNTLADEIRKAKDILADKNSTPETIAAAITALENAVTALTVDTTAPVVTPNAALPTQVKVGDALDVTVGLTSVDNIDGDISAGVTYTIAKVTGYEASGEPILGETIHTGIHGDGEKKLAKIGTVAIVYTSTDTKNNTTRVVRVVSVERADNDLLGTAITEGEQTVTNPNTVHNPALDDLKKAIEDGKKVFDDENSTQAQIDEAKAKIDDAKSKVDARDPAKIKDLRDLIDATDVKLTNPHLVHDDTKKALDDAINKARDILGKNTTTNKDLDDAINAINDLINNLQERDPNGFDDLRNTIGNGQNTSNDPNTVHNNTKTDLDKAIEDATKILDNPSTTQQQIDDAKKAIEDLINQVEKRDPANFDDIDDFIEKAENASNAPGIVNDDKKADLDKKIKDLKEMKDDPKTSNEDIVNKKKEILDAIAALNKQVAGSGGYAGGGSTGGGTSTGGGSSSSPIQWTSPIIPDTTPTNTDGNNNGNNNDEENTSFNSAPNITPAPTNTQVVNTPKVETPKTEAPVAPRVENGNILTQHITAKEGAENTFSVTNSLTNGVCTDIIRAHTYNDLVVKDNPQTAPFHDDIAALMMFRGAEKADNNIPNYEEYKRHGVVLNTEYFSPNRSVTRAEFVKMLVRSLSCHYTHLGTDTGFSDVENDKWYAEYIKFAAESKWINGYADGTFRPNAPITRAEAAKILSRAISLDTANASMETEFSDVPKGSEFIPYIESLKNLGVMKGKDASKFAPVENISRGETARIIYRTFLGGKL